MSLRILKRLEQVNRAFWLRLLARTWPNEPLRERLHPGSVRRVLFIRFDGLGDMITTLPAIRLVKRINPSAEIDVLASPRNAAVVRHDPNVAQVHVLAGGLLSLIRTVTRARRRDYDVVISCVFSKTTKSGIIANLAGPRAVKATVMRGERYRHLFNVQSSEAAARGSGWEKLIGIVEATIACASTEADLDPYLAIGADARAAAVASLEQLGYANRRFIAVNVSAFKPNNRWTVSGFEELVEDLLKDEDERVALLCVAEDFPTADRVRLALPLGLRERCVIYPPTGDPMEVAAVIESSWLVVTPDTGIVHVASATRRPVVALYLGSETGIAEWGPHRVPYRIVRSASHDAPVATILPQEVVAAVRDLQEELGASS